MPSWEREFPFGQILFTKDLDGIGPYLDPQQAVPREHVENAAKIVGLKQEDLEKTLRALSEHLGWDITKGSGQCE